MMIQGLYLKENYDTTQISTRVLTPASTSPAKVNGSAQFNPHSKFLGDHIALLSFCLKYLDVNTGDVSRLLEGFSCAFFGGTNKSLLISEHVKFDLNTNISAHKVQTGRIVKRLRAAGCVLKFAGDDPSNNPPNADFILGQGSREPSFS